MRASQLNVAIGVGRYRRLITTLRRTAHSQHRGVAIRTRRYGFVYVVVSLVGGVK